MAGLRGPVVDPEHAHSVSSSSTGGWGDADCGDVTYEGECQGDTVVWCENGLQSEDCGASGCGWGQEYGFYTCL